MAVARRRLFFAGSIPKIGEFAYEQSHKTANKKGATMGA